MSGSVSEIWGDSLEIRVMDVQQPFESLATTSRFTFDMFTKLWRKCIFRLKFLEDFWATFVKVRLKELWVVCIASIQMTANLKSSKIVTHSNLIDWMDMMMVLGTMKL